MSLSRSDGDIQAQRTNRRRWALQPATVGALPVRAVERQLFERYFAPARCLGSGRDGSVSLYRWRGAPRRGSHLALLDTPPAASRDDTRDVVTYGADQSVAQDARQDGVAVKCVQDRGKFDREVCMHAIATLAAARDRFDGLVPLLAIVVERSCQAMVPRMMIMPVMRETLEDELERAAASRWPAETRLKLHRRRWAQGDAVLEWLHSVARMIHGDAHTGNWFLYHDKPSRLLLGDFGEARTADEGVDDFATACARERTEFAFAMAPTGSDKRKLGAALGAIEARAAK